MPQYLAPLEDHRFLRDDVFDIARLSTDADFPEATPEIFEAVVEEAARFAQDILVPLNRPGSSEPVRFEAGSVVTPPGFREAYAKFVEAGWSGITARPEHGGQGLPHFLYAEVDEIFFSACAGFAMYRGLVDGAYHAILRHGSAELHDRFLPAIAGGTSLPTMNLTEAHSGSDLGLLRTRADPLDGDRYAITGTKIFITGGDHDLPAEIVHLVLARLPDAPAGSAGISLFVVPSHVEDPDTGAKTRNAVSCIGIEHKMGLAQSATCTMSYEGATGWLVGPPHGGLRAMFTMMNAARLSVGIQGVAAGEASFQIAESYAAERRQGRATGYPGEGPSPIAFHPDVARVLRTQKAWVQGGRALALRMALALDLGASAHDQATRARESDLAQIMTPVVKSFLSDTGFDAANLALQVLGGHGYIREWGVEQWVRDVRIAAIYEGTNAIQALDLVGRKLRSDDGRLATLWFGEIERDLRDGLAVLPSAEAGLAALAELRTTTAMVARSPQAAAVATEYQRFVGYVAMAGIWARLASAATQIADRRPEFAADKLVTARFYMERMLPAWAGLHASIHAGLADRAAA